MKANGGLVMAAVLALVYSAGFTATAATAHLPRCRGNPRLIGRCYWIRGEFSLSADSLFIIDRDDNGRWVIIRNARLVRGAGPVDYAVPRNLQTAFQIATNSAGSMGGAAVRGDFEVCPIPKDGIAESAYACIETAKHLRRISPNWMSPAQKRLHDQSEAELKADAARAAAAKKKEEESARRLWITPP
jgi:hypothetical protein